MFKSMSEGERHRLPRGNRTFAFDAFEVREPLRSMCDPQFTLYDHFGWGLRIKLQIKAHNANSPTEVGPITLDRPVDVDTLENATACHEFMRGMLKEVLLHECDESIVVQGVRIFDPHMPPGKGQRVPDEREGWQRVTDDAQLRTYKRYMESRLMTPSTRNYTRGGHDE